MNQTIYRIKVVTYAAFEVADQYIAQYLTELTEDPERAYITTDIRVLQSFMIPITQEEVDANSYTRNVINNMVCAMIDNPILRVIIEESEDKGGTWLERGFRDTIQKAKAEIV